MRPIDADALMDYCSNQKGKTIDANDIARFPTAFGWISVKDRKPPSIREPRYKDAFRPVLLYTKKDNSVYVGWYLGEDYRGIDCYISRTSMKSYQNITKKITHWMPLSEPPEEAKS